MKTNKLHNKWERTYFDLPFSKGHAIIEVFISFEAVIMISWRRGIPSVTFISPLPA